MWRYWGPHTAIPATCPTTGPPPRAMRRPGGGRGAGCSSPRRTPRPTRAALVRALPSIPALLRDAERVWVVLTEPTPPESREALLEAVEQTYRWREGADFRYVYVLLYQL